MLRESLEEDSVPRGPLEERPGGLQKAIRTAREAPERTIGAARRLQRAIGEAREDRGAIWPALEASTFGQPAREAPESHSNSPGGFR